MLIMLLCCRVVAMAGQRRKVLGHVVTDLCSRMNRTKKMPGEEAMETPLNRCLTTFDITLLGWFLLGAMYPMVFSIRAFFGFSLVVLN